MDYCSMQNEGCRIFSYHHRGHEFVTMQNQLLKLDICVSRGADILSLIYKPMDLDVMFQKADGVKDTRFVQTSGSSGGNFSDYMTGGWQELLPAGGPDTLMGAELGMHGEICLLPWSFRIIKDTASEIQVEFTGRTVRMPFEVIKIVTLHTNEPIVHLHEKVTNLGAQDLPYMWAQHPTYGAPLIEKGTRIDIPAKIVATSDFYHTPESRLPLKFEGAWPEEADGLEVVGDQPNGELLYFKELQEGWYAITNPNKNLGIGVVWDKEVFPYMVCWRALNSAPGSPWFDNVYALSLEFWNAFTDRLRTALPTGTVPTLKAKSKLETAFKIVLYTGKDRVERINADGTVI